MADDQGTKCMACGCDIPSDQACLTRASDLKAFCSDRCSKTILRVFCNDYDWVVAVDAKDALVAYCEYTGENPTDYGDDIEWEQCDDDSPLKISEDAPGTEPSKTKTCAEWAREHGRGFLCSTEY